MNSVIFDLDNCLSNDGWRIPRINWQKKGDERYHDYHLLAPFDKPDIVTKAILESHIVVGDRIIFCTARPVLYAAATSHWIGSNLLDRRACKFDLLMRNNGDTRTSPEVKFEMVRNLETYYNVDIKDIVMAYDDHQGIVDMYKEFGIPATRLFIHSLDAFHDTLNNKPAL